MKQLIATHDSVTAEEPMWKWLNIFRPFYQTQSKTLKEQYDVGCRYFDIRVKEYKGKLYGAHGFFITKKPILDLLHDLIIYRCSFTGNNKVYFNLTYEGFKYPTLLMRSLINYVSAFNNVQVCNVSLKYGKGNKWELKHSYHSPPQQDEFRHLDFSSWHTFLPIPWLYKRKVKFDNVMFRFVDFL